MILGKGNLTKSFTGAFFSDTVASMFVKFKQNLKSVVEIFWNEAFIIRNTVRKRKLYLDVCPLSVHNEALLT